MVHQRRKQRRTLPPTCDTRFSAPSELTVAAFVRCLVPSFRVGIRIADYARSGSKINMHVFASAEADISPCSKSSSSAVLTKLETETRPNLIGMSREEIEDAFSNLGLESYRSKQVWQWLYNKGATSFSNMTNIKRPVRETLDSSFRIDYGRIIRDHESTEDGTRKWLISHTGQDAETVYIPESDRGTVCISSQVGCSLTCKFCHTGTQPLVRNLSAGEIVSQVMTVKHALNDFNLPPIMRRSVTNLVFMGQGEPLYNYRALSRALNIIMSPDGLCMGKNRITVSTSGIVPAIKRLGEDHEGVGLAVSLHAARDDLRSEIMPINKTYPLTDLLQACRTFPGASWSHKITFEYVLLKGVNDSLSDARELVRLLKGIPCLVNLIPFNPWPGSQFECSSRETIVTFADELNKMGQYATVRWPRGRDIMAACGQLRSDSLKQSSSMATTAVAL